MSEKEISIIMGSSSDLPVMSKAADVIKEFDVPYEIKVVSAHRTPAKMFEYARSVKDRKIKVIIAGAGGAAHLPGMVAALTPLPVIGVPIRSTNSLDGWDSILSILQMPSGTPVATVALDQAKNAGLLALRILAVSQTSLLQKMKQFMKKQEETAIQQDNELEKQYE